jgi:hypothetical protein
MASPAEKTVDPPDADADARFAAYLADLAAHVDDPEEGDECRAILDEDPQTQRALFDLAEALATTPATLPASALWVTVVMLVLATTLGVLIVGFVS